MWAKACSGRPSTVKGLDTIPRFIGGVVGDDVVAPPLDATLLLLITVAITAGNGGRNNVQILYSNRID